MDRPQTVCPYWSKDIFNMFYLYKMYYLSIFVKITLRRCDQSKIESIILSKKYKSQISNVTWLLLYFQAWHVLNYHKNNFIVVVKLTKLNAIVKIAHFWLENFVRLETVWPIFSENSHFPNFRRFCSKRKVFQNQN